MPGCGSSTTVSRKNYYLPKAKAARYAKRLRFLFNMLLCRDVEN